MKSNLFMLFVIFITGALHAQKQDQSAMISIKSNISIPSENFGNSDFSNVAAGYAKVGPQLQVAYQFKNKHKIGTELVLNAQTQPFNTASLANKLTTTGISVGIWCGSTTIAPNIPPINPIKYSNWEFKKHPWKFLTAMGGVYRTFSISHQKNIELKTFFRAGLIYAQCPEINGSSIEVAKAAFIYQTKQTGWGIITNAGINIDYPIRKQWVIIANADYAASNPIKFKQVKATVTTTSGNAGAADFIFSQYNLTSDVAQTIKIWNWGIGIGYKL